MSDVPPWEPPLAGTETEQLLGALDRQRATFRWKADGRGPVGLGLTLGVSTLTLGGLLKHLALVEEVYSTRKLSGAPIGEPWPPSAEEDGREFETAAQDDPQHLYDLYDASVSAARQRYADAVARAGLDQTVHVGSDRGLRVSLRRLLLDLLEEYARHTGHADLLSEAVDGRVGEDPPDEWVPVGAVDDADLEPPAPRFEGRRMGGTVFRRVDLSGSRLDEVDLDGVEIREAHLARMRISGAEIYDVDIDAALKDVVVNGVDIVPLVEAERRRRDPDYALLRGAADADGFRAAYSMLQERWVGTVARARRLDPALLHESVDGEWSFVQTLRHLVYATESWVARGVLGDPAPWHALSLPPSAPAPSHGNPDPAFRPPLEEVLALRADRQAMVQRVLDGLTDEGLDVVPHVVGEGWPPPGHPVRECLAVVLSEEYEHRRFAERDLAVLESRA